MELTPNLKRPCIVAAQAQKHVTHNDVNCLATDWWDGTSPSVRARIDSTGR